MSEKKEVSEEIERGKIELKIQGLKGQMMAQHEITSIQLTESIKIAKDTLSQAKKTNGRVDRAELAIIAIKDDTEQEIKTLDKDTASALEIIVEDLELIRLFRKRKWLTLVFVIGTLKIYESIDFDWLVKLIVNLF